MRIGYFADGPWAHEALYKIIEQGHEVCFITPRYETKDAVLKRIANEHGIPWIVERNVNSREFIHLVKNFRCDILVSMSFNQIIKGDLLNASRLGFINCHAGALPYYRGRNPINWALINGEKKIGVTVHYIDEGIDTGDIITQDFIDIFPDDDYGTLLQKGFLQCAKSLCASLSSIESGSFYLKRQDSIHHSGFYCTKRVPGDEFIDWSESSEDIHNFIRAITKPAPGARSKSLRHDILIYKSRVPTDACIYKGVPGEVVGVTEEAWVVKTGTSVLEVFKEHVERFDKQDDNVRLRIGDRIGLTYGDLVNAVLGNNQ